MTIGPKTIREGRPCATRKLHHLLRTTVHIQPVLPLRNGNDGIKVHRNDGILGLMTRLIPTKALQHFATGSGIPVVCQVTKMKLLRNAQHRKEKEKDSLADADFRAAAIMVHVAKYL